LEIEFNKLNIFNFYLKKLIVALESVEGLFRIENSIIYIL